MFNASDGKVISESINNKWVQFSLIAFNAILSLFIAVKQPAIVIRIWFFGFSKYSPYDPAFTINDKKVIPQKLVEVDWVGTAFTLINMKVFKKMPRPWFEYDFNPKHIVGEDVLFCIKAKKLGYKVYVDPEVNIGHLLTVSIRKNKDGMLKIRR